MRGKKIILMGSLILSALAFAEIETRTAYILVPNDLKIEDVRAEGKISDGENFTTDGGVLTYDDTIGVNVFKGEGVEIRPSNMTSFEGTKYIEMAIEVDEGAEAKFVAGYPLSGTDDPTYVFIADPEIKDNTTVESNFSNESIALIDTIDEANFASFDEFPGKLLNEDIKISSFVVGDSEIGSEGQVAPSNIIDIYSKEGETHKVGGEAEVSPTGSETNNEFELWAVQYVLDGDGEPILQYELDSNGEPIPNTGVPIVAVDGDGEPLRVLLYTNKDMDPEPEYGDFSKMTLPVGQIYPSQEGDEFTAENSLWQFEVEVRFKNTGNIYVNNFEETVPLNKTGFKWNLYNLDSVTISNEGNQNNVKLLIGVTGGSVIIGLEDLGGYEDLPPSVGETLYVLDDTGSSKELNEQIISRYQGTERKRTSKVKVKVFSETGVADKSFDIEHITE